MHNINKKKNLDFGLTDVCFNLSYPFTHIVEGMDPFLDEMQPFL
jgi:hypothetical protein